LPPEHGPDGDLALSLKKIFSIQTQTSLDNRRVEAATQGGMQIASQLGGISVKGSLFKLNNDSGIPTGQPQLSLLLGTMGGVSYRWLIVVFWELLRSKLRIGAGFVLLICG